MIAATEIVAGDRVLTVTDETAAGVAADALQEQGDDAGAYLLRNLRWNQSGLNALVTTGTRAATQRKLCQLLRAADWKGVAALKRRSKSVKLSLGSHGTGSGALVYYVGFWCAPHGGLLCCLELPDHAAPGDKWQGMGVSAALALAGLDLDA